MPLQSIAPQRLYRQIAEQVRALIASGEFAAGARLPAERDLALQFDVSRPSVREALIALEVEGLVDVRVGSGIYVTDRSPAADAGTGAPAEWSPLELMDARRVIEGETAALAAAHAGAADLAAIRKALAAMRAQAAAGVAPREEDEAFHIAVADACGNEVLRDTVRGYWQAKRAPIFSRLGDYFETPTSWRAAITEHAAVLAAIRARDPRAARAAMQGHLKTARVRYSASWREANAA